MFVQALVLPSSSLTQCSIHAKLVLLTVLHVLTRQGACLVLIPLISIVEMAPVFQFVLNTFLVKITNVFNVNFLALLVCPNLNVFLAVAFSSLTHRVLLLVLLQRMRTQL